MHASDKVQENGEQCVVYMKNTVSLDGNGEYIVQGFIHSATEINDGGNNNYIFSPDTENLAKRGLLAANSISECHHSSIPVRLYLPEGERKTIYRGTKLGCISKHVTPRATDEICVFGVTETDESAARKKFLEQFTIGGDNESVQDILWRFKNVFSKSKMDLGCADIRHKIDTGNSRPIALKPRRMPIAVEQDVENMISDMLRHGIIRRSTSPWCFPLVIVKKKSGDLRICVDFRKLNEITKRPIYPIPDSSEIFDTVGTARFFSTLDLSQGYHQVPLLEQDKCKTAFATKSGHYEYDVMPFGLCGAPATFQRLMQTVLQKETWHKCVVYLDDVLIFGETEEEHNSRLQTILQRFQEANLRLSPSKCHFLQEQIQYLGHIINKNGISTDPEKISKVADWPTPTCAEELHAFLGLSNYYRRFISDYSQISNPLWKTLVRKPFNWNKAAEDSFGHLKRALTSAPVLALPVKGSIYILDTDASHNCIGAVLSQVQNGVERVISYASNKMSQSQIEYCVTRKELLAAYTYITKFKHYLMGQPFLLRTDHKALQWLLDWKKPTTSQFCNWKSSLEAFDFTIQHRKGVNHGNADALSRHGPCGQCQLKHPNPRAKRNVKVFDSKTLSSTSIEKEHVMSFSHCDYADSQVQDAHISSVIALMKSNRLQEERPPELDQFGNALWKFRQQLRIRGDMLYLLKAEKYLLVLPATRVQETVLGYHKRLCHLGQEKTAQVIKERYFWTSADYDIRKVLSSCQICAIHKPAAKRKQVNPSPTLSEGPFQLLCIDVAGPFNRTVNNNRYIFGLIDHYTKNTVLIPMKSIDALSLARAVYKHWIVKYGMPEEILSDNGAYFSSEVFSALCSTCGIKRKFSPPHHQQSNGLVERLFQTVKPLLSATVAEHKKEWDEVLPSVELTLRAATQSTTGISPFASMYGIRMRLPEDWLLCGSSNLDPQRFQKIRREIDAKIRKMQGKTVNKKAYQTHNFTVGDKVLLKNTAVDNRIPRHYYTGPYQVIEKVGTVIYKVKCCSTGSVWTRHANHIKRWPGTRCLQDQRTTEQGDPTLFPRRVPVAVHPPDSSTAAQRGSSTANNSVRVRYPLRNRL